MTKSLKTAYVCWLLGGLFGAHHVYLGRYNQAFVYCVTLGGFLVAWLRDIYRLPDYLNESNDSDEFRAALAKRREKLLSPGFEATRFFGALIASLLLAYMLANALHQDAAIDASFDWLVWTMRVVIPFVVAGVVYAVTTEGPVCGSFAWSLVGSYAAFALGCVRANLNHNYFGSAVLSSLFLNWSLDWDNDYKASRQRKSLIKFLLLATVSFWFVFSCTLLCVINNAKIEKDGRNITLRQSIIESFDNEDMKKLKELYNILYNFYQEHGFIKLVNYVFYGSDPEALDRAYAVYIYIYIKD